MGVKTEQKQTLRVTHYLSLYFPPTTTLSFFISIFLCLLFSTVAEARLLLMTMDISARLNGIPRTVCIRQLQPSMSSFAGAAAVKFLRRHGGGGGGGNLSHGTHFISLNSITFSSITFNLNTLQPSLLLLLLFPNLQSATIHNSWYLPSFSSTTARKSVKPQKR